MSKTPRSLGSAKHGVEHWWQQRVTAIALIFLSIYVVAAFFMYVVFGDFNEAIDWLSSPFAATAMILFIAVAFLHAALGLQVVIEDYVHHEGLKIFSILAAKFISAAFAVLGILSTIKVLFWSNLPHG